MASRNMRSSEVTEKHDIIAKHGDPWESTDGECSEGSGITSNEKEQDETVSDLNSVVR